MITHIIVWIKIEHIIHLLLFGYPIIIILIKFEERAVELWNICLVQKQRKNGAFLNGEYPVILAASKGDPDAMKIVLQHFSGYIASLSMRKLYDERGNVYFGVDEEIRERLQAKLMRAILTFRAE